MKRRIMAATLSLVVVMGSVVTVSAAPRKMSDGNTFDAVYYAALYPDVVHALGTDEEVLYRHYLSFGMFEGRSPVARNTYFGKSGTGSRGGQTETVSAVSSATKAVPERRTASEDRGASRIGVEAAKRIALSHAGLSESEVRFVKAKEDSDDGRYEYEIEFKKGRIEYEYDIDAITGNILKYDSEYDD